MTHTLGKQQSQAAKLSRVLFVTEHVETAYSETATGISVRHDGYIIIQFSVMPDCRTCLIPINRWVGL